MPRNPPHNADPRTRLTLVRTEELEALFEGAIDDACFERALALILQQLESPRGLILLDGALAHLECERVATYEAGDHTILVGRVVAGAVTDGRPLCYFRGGYASLA